MEQRVLKFRAWHKTLRAMSTSQEEVFDLISYEPTGFQFLTGDYSSNVYVLEGDVAREDLVIMQFTGLHDKQSQEIYEGDIIDYNGTPARVSWHPQGWWGMYFYSQEDNEEVSTFLANARDTWPVIGNAIEHPHLLTREVDE